MEGKFPRTVLTDLDMELKDAMINELPSTKHVFAIWHLTSKLSSWFSNLLGSQFDKFVSDFLRVCNLDSIAEFDLQWNQMVLDFGLDSDRHIAILSFQREYWAFPYLRGCFLGGLMRNGLPTSIKSFFKGPLNSQTRLKDFLEQVTISYYTGFMFRDSLLNHQSGKVFELVDGGTNSLHLACSIV